ncbi:cell division protein ZapA [Desulfovibrio psychrotolerans]|uniref:Cell division protein ZapA n=1 Tax=Desulfovibrio psychrotolerans TaxID=415242 RepID=A0A7J0BV87_9BACT|nr:cell division protein ZapA [Desulfovibrio psychrotolerans]GFM37075.1 cell division protein ZapA [Desulfovibrio psychrotolerans]
MRRYNLNVLDLEVSFKAEADPLRVENAKKLVEERFEKLNFPGRQISKEKLLTFLVLGLADDLLQSDHKLKQLNKRVQRIMDKIDSGTT